MIGPYVPYWKQLLVALQLVAILPSGENYVFAGDRS